MGKSLRISETSRRRATLVVIPGPLRMHRHRVSGCRYDRWEAGHLSGDEVEARAVLRALDIHVPQLAIAQRELLVGADVVERVEVAILRAREAHGRPACVDPLQRLRRHFGHRCDPIPSQDAPRARSRPAVERARTGSARGLRRRIPARSSAWRSLPGYREIGDRTSIWDR